MCHTDEGLDVVPTEVTDHLDVLPVREDSSTRGTTSCRENARLVECLQVGVSRSKRMDESGVGYMVSGKPP